MINQAGAETLPLLSSPSPVLYDTSNSSVPSAFPIADSIKLAKGHGASSEGTASLLGSVFTLSNSAIGAGVLAIPFAVSKCGIGMSLLMFLFVAATTFWSLHLFGAAVLEVRRRGLPSSGYEDIAYAAGGRVLGGLAKGQIIFSIVGAMIAFLIILRQLLWDVALRWGTPEDKRRWWYSQNWMTTGAVVLIVAPLSLFRDLSGFRFASLLALGTVGYISGAIVFYAVTQSKSGASHGPLEYFTLSWDVCFALPTLIFAFGCHSCVPEILAELRGRSSRRFDIISACAMAMCLVFYAAVGLAGYASFRGATDGNILLNYSADNVAIGLVGRLAMALVVCCTFPLLMWPARHALDALLFADRPFSMLRHCAITLSVVALTLGIALLYPSLTVVFALSGSTGAVLNVFIFPALFYLWLAAGPTARDRLPAQLLIVYGVAVGVICTAVIVYRIAT